MGPGPKYYAIDPGRDIARTWRPELWVVVEVAYTGHIVGFHVYDDHTEAEAHALIVSTGRLAIELLLSNRS